MARQNNKMSNNYFTQQIQRNGVNFLDGVRDDNLLRDAVRIFRDLARGNINIDQYGDYFSHPRLLNAAITASYSKFTYHSISHAGVAELLQKNTIPYPSAPTVLNAHSRSAQGYKLIFDAMTAIANTGQYNEILKTLVNNLNNYRYDL